jgi:hypothetical protein
MTISRARIAIPFLALALLAGPALTGCSSQALAEGVAEGVAAENGQEIDLNTDGGMPDGFPENIPVIEGDVISGVAVGDGGTQTWTVQIAITDPEAAYNEIKTGLEKAGFSSDFTGMNEGQGYGTFDDGAHSVVISTGDNGTNVVAATYIVSNTMR